MVNKFIVSGVYEVDPSTVKYDTAICTFNKPKSQEGYDALKKQIEEDGQLDPGYMRNGLLGDGVHRAKIAKELGLMLKVVDIDPNIDDKEYIRICNTNVFTSRNDSATQLAIKAYNLTLFFDYTDAEARIYTGVKDKKAISLVRTVAASKYAKDNKILDALLEGKPVKVGNKFTKSIEVVYKELRNMEETEVVTTDIPEVSIRYDDYIDSYEAKEVFWRDYSRSDIPVDVKLKLIGLLNAVYKSGGKEN